MTYQDDRQNQTEADWSRIEQQKRDLRKREKELGMREKVLGNLQQYNGDVSQLRSQLRQSLPPYMVPSNVGGLNEVSWPFYYKIEFNLGVVPVFNNSIRQTRSFQVSQESAFILLSISRSQGAPFDAKSAPVQIEYRDRQSSRQFNDKPVPVQMIGTKSNPTILPTGMLLMPNAFFDATISSIATGSNYGVGWAMNFSFFGVRVRVEDADKVLSTIFG